MIKDTKLITIDDVRARAAEVYRNIAYGMTHGDMVSEDLGIHGRRDPHTNDAARRSKLDTYEASSGWDDPWFQKVVEETIRHPHRLPPSRETRIKKESGGTRPIGDPAECKRVRATYIREVIEDRLETMLLPSQLGGRPLGWLLRALGEHIPCIRKGATPQDQMATLAQQYIHAGYSVVLCMDLANAFGLLPKQAVLPELRAAGISKGACEYIWRHARLDAVSVRSGDRIPYSPYMGVEQGGVLSALLLNLGLAPILKAVNVALDVKVLAYVDDIYIFCKSIPDAEEAFNVFRKEARARGFRNIRGIQSPDAPESKKASTIQVITDDNPLVVLKRDLVAPSFIGMTPKAIEYLKEQMAIREITSPISYQEVRNLSGQQALTKKGIRKSVPELLISPTRGRGEPPPREEPPKGTKPKGEGGEVLPSQQEGGTIHHMVTEVQVCLSALPQDEGAHPVGRTPLSTRAGSQDHDRSSAGRCKQADGTVADTDGNHQPTEGDAQGAGWSGTGSPTNLSRSVSVTDPEMTDLIRQKKPIKLGDRRVGIIIHETGWRRG